MIKPEKSSFRRSKDGSHCTSVIMRFNPRENVRVVKSTVCRFEHFHTEWFRRFASALALDNPDLPDDQRNVQRKVWEFCAISAALEQRGMLREGRKGLGFAVGKEPLPSLFASLGAQILATDLAPNASKRYWIKSGQHASSADALFQPNLIDRDTFDTRVNFRHADMRKLDDSIGIGQFDFLWSSCAFEHLGSLRAGVDFVCNAMRFLKPCGIAVHTTEYNVSSNDETLFRGNTVVYRRRDIEQLAMTLRKQRCGMEAVDFDPGTHPFDLNYDREPFFQSGRKHLKLEIGSFVCTSIVLVIHKS